MNSGDEHLFFQAVFHRLTQHNPFPWQKKAFASLLRGELPNMVNLPTGTGKTSLIPIWLSALIWQAKHSHINLPRRLVWVVNRRVVVDQATEEAMTMVGRIQTPEFAEWADPLSRISLSGCLGHVPVAISTLRGQMADNGDWKLDPSRPAIIIGTVDMIGSRLLFSGYGDGKYKRPLHAGLLGQDAWVILDEAHLTPAFAELLQAIRKEQQRFPKLAPWHVSQLSATQREGDAANSISLSVEDKADDIIGGRLRARKSLYVHELGEKDDELERIATCALAHKDAQRRVIVFVKSPEAANRVCSRIGKEHSPQFIRVLTGTQRGFERDALANDSVFTGFRANPKRQPPSETHYLIATAAGEVGADLDADHLICDLTPLDSLIQRFGRVNRLGLGAARIDLVVSGKTPKNDAEKSRLNSTLAYLKARPRNDEGCPNLSPIALTDQPADAYTATPVTVPLAPHWLDMWSMTSIPASDWRDRPEVAPWLHGVVEDLPETWVAWRDDISWLGDPTQVSDQDCTKVLDVYPVLTHEQLREPTGRIWKMDKGKPQACKLFSLMQQESNAGKPVLLLRNGTDIPWRGTLEELVSNAAGGELNLAFSTVLLPTDMGGLSQQGTFEPHVHAPAVDVADLGPGTGRKHFHAREEENQWVAFLGSHPNGKPAYAASSRSELMAAIAKAEKLKLAAAVRLGQAEEDMVSETDGGGYLLYFADAAKLADSNAKSFIAATPQSLPDHLQLVGSTAQALAQDCALPGGLLASLSSAFHAAGCEHDTGKGRICWQRAIGNGDATNPLAKSGHDRFNTRLNDGYRHEFGSLLDAAWQHPHDHPNRDLILQLIAGHHGNARPHFNEQGFDRETAIKVCREAALDAMRRFGHLQARYGWWGLAYLEALLKAADALVSAGIVKGDAQ